jgi:predicted translin family RNA/ssDNA-binding protein
MKDGKAKVKSFLSCLPQAYKDIIDFDYPKALNEVLRIESMNNTINQHKV